MTIKDGQSASPADKEDDVTSSAAASTADDDTLEQGSSPESTGDDAGADTQDDETLADAIGNALKGDEDDSDGEEDDSEDDNSESEDDGENAPDAKDKTKSEGDESGQEEDSEDDGSDLAEGQRVPYNRFKKVIDQRNDYKERISSLEREAQSFKQGHEQFQAISGFMRENEVSAQDASEALQIAALINHDPQQAMQMLTPIVQRLQQFTGDILPDDLQQQVDTGEISEQAARELVRTRNQNAQLNYRQQREAQQRQQQGQQAQVQAAQQAMADTANRVQQEIMNSDPDYQRKAPLVRDRVRVMIQEQRPQTAEQAEKIMREAHKQVTQELRQFKPRQEMRPGPNSEASNGTAAQEQGEPGSMLEAMQRAAQQS